MTLQLSLRIPSFATHHGGAEVALDLGVALPVVGHAVDPVLLLPGRPVALLVVVIVVQEVLLERRVPLPQRWKDSMTMRHAHFIHAKMMERQTLGTTDET